ncbi:MAG: DNA repair protein RadC [Pseudomonadota bacterium]
MTKRSEPPAAQEAPDLFGAAPKPADRPPSEKPDDPKPEDLRLGHRERLRARFMGGGPAAVADYELLELVLFRAISRQDVKPIAKRLLARFGDFNGVVSAAPERLREVTGVGDAAIREIKIVEAAAHKLVRTRAVGRTVLSSWEAVLDYCRATMAHRATEEFRVLYLDAKNQLLADEASTPGTVDQAPVYPREVVKRALELNASAMLLVHNHPSGDPEPSDADIRMTHALLRAAEAVGLTIHDHVVIGKGREVSFRGRNLI